MLVTLTLISPVATFRVPRVSAYETLHCVITTVKPLLSGHLQDLPKSPLNRGCKNCAMFVNDQHSTVTVYCDKGARC